MRASELTFSGACPGQRGSGPRRSDILESSAHRRCREAALDLLLDTGQPPPNGDGVSPQRAPIRPAFQIAAEYRRWVSPDMPSSGHHLVQDASELVAR